MYLRKTTLSLSMTRPCLGLAWERRRLAGESLLNRYWNSSARRWRSQGVVLVVSLLVFFAFCVFGAETTSKRPKSDKEIPVDDIFAGTNVLRIRILIPNSGISALRGTGWGNGQERPRVKAIVREGGRVYTNVEVHLKGAAGSFRPVDDNPGLTLNFEKEAPGQTFHGYHKISLNNSVQDRSYLTEKICRELFEAAGVPAPHAGFAKVELNGRDLGLRVMVEGYGKQFLKRYFTNTKGNLYDGGFVEDIDAGERLQVNSGENPQDHSGLQALINAVQIRDPQKRFEQLQQTLDMDRFLSYVAMDVMQCDWDGYAMNHNNWRLFHDQAVNKMVFLPHGLDQMFGVERSTPECPILPHMSGRVAVAVLKTSEGKRRYLERMSELYTNVWHVQDILKRVDQLAAVIRPVIAETSPSVARYHDSEVENLKERITERDQSLRTQLASVQEQPKIQVNGTLPLSGWTRRTQSGNAEFRQEKSPEGQDLLYLAVNGNTICSWRSRTMLEEGVYRFEGKVRTKNVKTGSEPGGAGLRISGKAVVPELSGTQDWQKFGFPFRVPEGGGEIEVICELRATRGEAWFDTSTLRVVRLR
jgi:spore coat protein CotH